MKLLIAGGGTGGHLFPGIALAEEFMKRGENFSVMFAVTDRGLESRTLDGLNLPYTVVRAAGVVGAGPKGILKAAALLVAGFIDAGKIIRSFKPNACIGVGGYVSFPVAALASIAGIPTAIQEQNAFPGLTNRILSRLVKRIYAPCKEAAAALKSSKTIVTGNPVREAFGAAKPYEYKIQNERPARILILGGSQGSKALNENIPQALSALSCNVEVIHQAGRDKAPSVEHAYGNRPGVRVDEFIDDISAALSWSDLIICRAGALTVAELAASGRPAIFIPFPHAAGGHQEANARAAETAGAGVCMLESDLKAGKLPTVLKELLCDAKKLTAMAEAAAASARNDAAKRIIDDLTSLMGALDMERL